MVQLVDEEGKEPSEACAVAVDRVLDIAEEHPEAARLYAQPGKADLPPLASHEEGERCGDLEKLLEELARARSPVARIIARLRERSARVTLSSRTPSDGVRSPVTARSWRIDGKKRGTARVIHPTLDPRKKPYEVRLKVTDADGQQDEARLTISRLPASFFFATDRETLSDPEGVRALRRDLPTATTVRIEGHADFRGGKAYNDDLSWRRALAVRRVLLARRRDPGPLRVETRAFGKSCPLAKGNSDPALKRNRRVDVLIQPRNVEILTAAGCQVRRAEVSFYQRHARA